MFGLPTKFEIAYETNKDKVESLSMLQYRLACTLYNIPEEDTVTHYVTGLEYEEVKKELQGMLDGENTPCWACDEDLWAFFSDAWKDVNGFRPRFNWPCSEVEAWIQDLRDGKVG